MRKIMKMQCISNMAGPVEQGVLLDQFGVLHDGLSPYPAIHEAVQYLAETGARIVILSNSSRSKLLSIDVSKAKQWSLRIFKPMTRFYTTYDREDKICHPSL
jgi:ribonucleotide monophosphatase NagD (HAD superfamily)